MCSQRSSPPVLSFVNEAEWRNCRNATEWHHERLHRLPSRSIPAFYGLKRRIGQNDGQRERQRRLIWIHLSSVCHLSQLYPVCMNGSVWLPGNNLVPVIAGNVRNIPHNQDLSWSLLNQTDPITFWKHHSTHASLSYWHHLLFI